MMASGLLDLAKAAANRLPPRPEGETVKPDAGGETEPAAVATAQPTRPMPAVESPPDKSESRDEKAERATSMLEP
jgi:hypothetical protein